MDLRMGSSTDSLSAFSITSSISDTLRQAWQFCKPARPYTYSRPSVPQMGSSEAGLC